MERIHLLAITLLCSFFIFFCFPDRLHAQNTLERISLSERSDGKGFVARYHLDAKLDSFLVVQPSPQHIQMKLYSPGLDTLNYINPDDSDILDGINFHKSSKGLGVDIFLQEGNYLQADAYPDQNQKDLLLSLEKTERTVLHASTDYSDMLLWVDYMDEDPLDMEVTLTSTFDEADDSYIPLRNGRDFNVIVLDAGHGGHDPGAINRELGLMEKDIALQVTLRVGEYIKEHMPDVEVIYTRTDDSFVKLEERGLIATRAKGDLFVSIHANSARNARAHGAEIFFLGLARSQSALEVMKRENSVVDLENGGGPMQLSEEELMIYELANSGNIAISERIATMIEHQFRTRAQRRSRGVKQAGLMALWHASTPAVLIELGFLSNPTEARYMASDYGQAILASAIFRAIRDFKEEYDRSLRHNNTASNE